MYSYTDVFSELVRVHMDSNNECFDSASNNWHELKNSLQFTQHKVDILKNNTSKLTGDKSELKKT